MSSNQQQPSFFRQNRSIVIFTLILVAVTLLFGIRIHPAPETIDPSEGALSGGQPLTRATHFVVVGDTGSGMAPQFDIADRMFELHEKHRYRFVLLLGDMIYPNGDVIKYGHERFTKPYKSLLKKGVQFLPTLGNHDVMDGNRKNIIKFFKMPGDYYDFVVDDVHFIAIDTNEFNQEQAQWLAETLGKSQSLWKIVYGHHPVYSSGEHGATRNLVRHLQPILEAHGVDLYLSGHDHDYERFSPKNGVTYMISGGGGGELRGFRLKPATGSVVRATTYHFIHFAVQEETLYFEAIDHEGQIFDTGTMTKTRQDSLKPAA